MCATLACANPETSDPGSAQPGFDSAAPAAAMLLDPARWDVEVCDTDTLPHHPTAESLVVELVRRARTGSFDRAGDWLPTATLCPGVEPGYDTFFVLDDVRIEWLFLHTDTAVVVLHSRQLGTYDGAFRIDVTERADTLVVLRTRAGWRFERTFWNWMDAQEARRRKHIE